MLRLQTEVINIYVSYRKVSENAKFNIYMPRFLSFLAGKVSHLKVNTSQCDTDTYFFSLS